MIPSGRISASIEIDGLKVELTVSVDPRIGPGLLEAGAGGSRFSGASADEIDLALRSSLAEMPRLLLEAHPRFAASILQASLDSIRGVGTVLAAPAEALKERAA